MRASVADLLEYREDGPVTKKVVETDRTIVTLVCLRPGQAIPPFTHRRREAFVHVLEGSVRITPGGGPPELRAGDLAYYDGSRTAGPSNPGTGNASFRIGRVQCRVLLP